MTDVPQCEECGGGDFFLGHFASCTLLREALVRLYTRVSPNADERLKVADLLRVAADNIAEANTDIPSQSPMKNIVLFLESFLIHREEYRRIFSEVIRLVADELTKSADPAR
jgi:hypothetical protein